MAGVLIAYATAPKQTASDVGEGGGPYAKTLAEEIVKPDFEAVAMFRNVQLKVKQWIGQDPWLMFPSLPEVYLAGKTMQPPTVPADPARPSRVEVAQFCQSIAANPSIPVVQSLRDTYKGTPMGACAEARLDELKRMPMSPPQTP